MQWASEWCIEENDTLHVVDVFLLKTQYNYCFNAISNYLLHYRFPSQGSGGGGGSQGGAGGSGGGDQLYDDGDDDLYS